MQRIDSRTVELTPAEQQTSEEFEDVLDTGLGIRDAAYAVLSATADLEPSPEFVEWLSDGTLTVSANGTIETTAFGASLV